MRRRSAFICPKQLWHKELWFHEAGDRSWLVVTRNTLTHEIAKVEFARDVARRRGRST